jgi:hypothetical protein
MNQVFDWIDQKRQHEYSRMQFCNFQKVRIRLNPCSDLLQSSEAGDGHHEAESARSLGTPDDRHRSSGSAGR